MSLSVGHKRNFETLRRAFLAGDAALVECRLAASGERVAVICGPPAACWMRTSSWSPLP